MDFPYLRPRPRTSHTVDAFGGYNHNLSIGEQEFYRMENFTSDLAPVLSPRPRRGLYARDVSAQGMIARDSLCYVDGRFFVINRYPIDLGLSTEEKDCPKQLVSMGAYVIILPDKKYINTADLTDFGPIEAEFTAASPVRILPCRLDGTEYTPDFIQPQQPTAAENLNLWMDTSVSPHSLKQYSQSLDLWTGIETTYVKLRCAGLGKAFSQYDGITLSGLSGLEDSQLAALEGSQILYGCEEDAVIITGLLDAPVTVEAPVTVARKMPAMDFILESGNRLWGCRYGLNNEGKLVNELYACALGDFKNWNRYLGISSDSYFVALGADGPFTGAISHSGHPLFFREGCLHKIFGQMPSNFQVQTTVCRGVQKGCNKSLAIVGEVLYYKARHGVCAYDGSLPQQISQALGDVSYEQAVAGGHGSKYYISMRPAGQQQAELFVYDTAKRLWHREDNLKVREFCSCPEELYCATEDGCILSILGSGEAYEQSVPWMLETGILGGSGPEKIKLAKLSIRLVLEPGSHMHISAQYDSASHWQDLGYLTGTDLRSFTLPVRPRRCDHLRLRLEGSGSCRIFSITKTYCKGSDV